MSAGTNTVDNVDLADPDSAIIAELTLKLLTELEAKAKRGQPLLTNGVALNVNFPNAASLDSEFAFHASARSSSTTSRSEMTSRRNVCVAVATRSGA